MGFEKVWKQKEMKTWDLTLAVHVLGSPAHSEKVLQWVSAVMSHRQDSLPNAAGLCCVLAAWSLSKKYPLGLARWVWWDHFALLNTLLVMSSACFAALVIFFL